MGDGGGTEGDADVGGGRNRVQISGLAASPKKKQFDADAPKRNKEREMRSWRGEGGGTEEMETHTGRS